ncbi:ragulator complex protein LAMTOR1 isoform X1 [Sapajus apella]|uniref:Ragulator complex protein LAMTOR1 n=1 Tax=Sapajus apella TaxID=9515 RepID=A0A6J3GA18_SAPAP|nr:ragulator complex protein LAMTOR1 isoform X1 [Sapajus apella]
MGCCYSSENEDSDQDREERKLLLDPSSPPTKALNGAEPNYHSLPSARTDEQALLSSILAKTASNIIDVSAADSQGMEQHEYMDRARQYSTRLAVLSSSLTHWKKLPPLPSLTSQPHQVLASEPIPFSDLQQVQLFQSAHTLFTVRYSIQFSKHLLSACCPVPDQKK